MNKKSWSVFALIVIAIIGGLIYMSLQNRLDVSNISQDRINGVLAGEERNGHIGDHTKGNKQAKVRLIEYGDYQCPGCRTSTEEVDKLMSKYQDHLELVFRNFPIPSLHPNARAAAAVAEAAGLQGKYWQMHDLLYKNQTSWSTASSKERSDAFLGYAKQLQLNEQQFTKDLNSAKIAQKIDYDVAIARKQNITGTPAFYLNGKAVQRQKDGDLEKAVVEALKQAGVNLDTAQKTEGQAPAESTETQ